MNMIELNKIEIASGETLGYRECGSGDKILLLIHGNMTSSKHWDLLMEQLKYEYKIYAIDLRGFGISTYNTEINSLKDFSEDVKMFVDKLGIKGFILAGWSTGGGVAMQFAAYYPEYVEKLILVESVGITGYPIFKKDDKGQSIIGEFLRTKEEIANDPIQVLPVLNAIKNKDKETYRIVWNSVIYTKDKPSAEKYEEYLEDMLTQRNLVDVDYALTRFNMSNMHNGVVEGSGDIDKIKAPTIIFQGDRDLVVPMQMGQGIAEALGDRGKLVILNDSGHSPFIDCLDRITKEIKEFLK
ncbi:intracellular short-chain-length polyhydroxyalkanoate depolymerase [Clostridium sp. DL1XJH146]